MVEKNSSLVLPFGMLPLESIAANTLGALLAAFCLWLLSFICPPLRRFFLGVPGFLRCVIRCRTIARENAELKAALAAKDAELNSLRQALERSQQIHALAQQRLGIHIAQVLQAVSQRKNSWPLSAGQTIPAWPIEYEAHVIHEARDRGLLFLDPILRRLSVTPEGITFLIDSGHIPTPE